MVLSVLGVIQVETRVQHFVSKPLILGIRMIRSMAMVLLVGFGVLPSRSPGMASIITIRHVLVCIESRMAVMGPVQGLVRFGLWLRWLEWPDEDTGGPFLCKKHSAICLGGTQ